MLAGILTASRRTVLHSSEQPGGEPTTFVYPFVAMLSPFTGEVGNYSRSPKLFIWYTNIFSMSWQIGTGYDSTKGDTSAWVSACRNGTASWPNVRLLVDNVPITGWQAPSNTSNGTYSFTNVSAANGHHVASVELQSTDPDVFVGSTQVFAKDFIVNTTGTALPTQVPWTAVQRFERDIRAHMPVAWTQVAYPGSQPVPFTQPLKPRIVEHYNELLSADQQWVRRLTHHGGHMLFREFVKVPSQLPGTGGQVTAYDIGIASENKYDYGFYTGPGIGLTAPAITMRDGPRYVGMLGVITKIVPCRGNNGFYMTDVHGRLLHMSNEGEINTIVGWRVKPGELKAHPGIKLSTYQHASNQAHKQFYEDQWEFLGDWSQVPITLHPHRFQNVRGFAVAKRNTDNSIDTFEGREFWIPDEYHNRILYVNARTMDAVEDYEQPHFPPNGYEAPAAPTGQAQVIQLFGGDPSPFCDRPHDCRINPFDGKLYWTNFAAGTICRANTDGTGLEIVVQTSINPTDADLEITPNGQSNLTTAEIRASYRIDGGPGVATCVRPCQFDFLSTGELVWMERFTFSLRKVDLNTKQVATIAEPNVSQRAFGLYDPTLCIDREGTCGPVDDIFTEIYDSNDRRYSKTGSLRTNGNTDGRWHRDMGNALGRAPNGPLSAMFAGGYVMGIGVGNGRICVSGNAAGWIFAEITKRQATDPAYNETMFNSGADAYLRADSGYSPPAVEAMVIKHGPYGQGSLGFPTAEEMAGWDDATLASYGLANNIPSDKINDFIYFIRWCAVEHDYS